MALDEAATVTWVRGAHRPRIGLLQPNPSSSSVLDVLCTCLWPREPARRPAPGAVAPRSSGVTRHLAKAGVEPAFLDDIRHAVAPGTSALLVLALDVDLDTIRTVTERGRARGDVALLHTWLAPDAAEHIAQARNELGR